MPLIDPADAEERRKVQAFLDRLIERALSYGGHLHAASMASARARFAICSPSMAEEFEAMIAIKKALDPLNILNPGKIFALP